MEVLVALAIFLLSFAAIGELVTMSGDRALALQYQAEATALCQSKLAEVHFGATPLSAQSETPFDEAPEYHWSMECDQGSVSGLWNVTIHVTREAKGGGKVEVALSQMVLDPSQRGSTLDLASSSSGSSSSNSSGSQSGNQSQSGQQSSQQSSTPAAGASSAAMTRPATATTRPGTTGQGTGTMTSPARTTTPGATTGQQKGVSTPAAGTPKKGG
jgi:hypothetical protein